MEYLRLIIFNKRWLLAKKGMKKLSNMNYLNNHFHHPPCPIHEIYYSSFENLLQYVSLQVIQMFFNTFLKTKEFMINLKLVDKCDTLVIAWLYVTNKTNDFLTRLLFENAIPNPLIRCTLTQNTWPLLCDGTVVLRGPNHPSRADVLPAHTVFNWLTAEFTFSFL